VVAAEFGERELSATRRPHRTSFDSGSVLSPRRIAINDSASVRADIDAAVQLGITGDVQQQSPLVLIVIDADPAPGRIVRTENSTHAVDHADQIERG